MAALGCREYHGYQRGYNPLTPNIIFCCGYRDAHGGVISLCINIILLHQHVMDAWVNHCTQQRGPSVDRIMEKGIPVFPKLASLAVDSTVEFNDKLQKTSALFLLPLMPFDLINLHMGFEGLCPPGLGLPQYTKNCHHSHGGSPMPASRGGFTGHISHDCGPGGVEYWVQPFVAGAKTN